MLSLPADQIADLAQRASEVTLDIFPIAFVGAVNALGEAPERTRLQPDATWPRERREEQPFPAEQARLDPADTRDVVIHARVERHEAAGVDAKPFAGLQIERHNRPAREQLALEPAEQSPIYLRVHVDAIGHEHQRARFGADDIAGSHRHDDRLHVVAQNLVIDHLLTQLSTFPGASSAV